MSEPVISCLDLHPPQSEFIRDVTEGLLKEQKQLNPKYFYDERGSRLFDEICDLEEYYPTNTEIDILIDHAGDLAGHLSSDNSLIEFGSGSSAKIDHILEHNPGIRRYMPLDISREHLMKSARDFCSRWPKVEVTAVVGDFLNLTEFPDKDSGENRTVFFPGSSIGNLEKDDMQTVLEDTRRIVGDNGLFIVGVDLIKDRDVLHKAYNDSKGVTAAFNRNILHRMNDEFGAGFRPESWRHEAIYNESKDRVEMHLVCPDDQEITLGDQTVRFTRGETIHTESSHKFSVESFSERAGTAGFRREACYQDKNNYFAVMALRAEAAADA